ncbi:hypothetical protein JCM5296_004520 [Sporobolomyces johnsonii]
MTVVASPALLHPHPSPSLLLALLEGHLPYSLPLYSTLFTPGTPTPVCASFSPGDLPSPNDNHGPWLVLADLGNQIRFFCSFEAKQPLGQNDQAAAETLVARALREYLTLHRGERTVIRIGAIPDLWVPAVEREFNCKVLSPSQIWSTPALASSSRALPEPPALPEGMYFGPVREEHIPEILSTSEVPHPPSYLSTRLAYTSALFSSPAAAPAAPSSSRELLIAHCITHRDGSIGTVHVHPSYRRHGLGKLLLRDRIAAMHREGDGEGEAYCYVSRSNERSQALMRSVGMVPSEERGDVSWAVVELPTLLAAAATTC